MGNAEDTGEYVISKCIQAVYGVLYLRVQYGKFGMCILLFSTFRALPVPKIKPVQNPHTDSFEIAMSTCRLGNTRGIL